VIAVYITITGRVARHSDGSHRCLRWSEINFPDKTPPRNPLLATIGRTCLSVRSSRSGILWKRLNIVIVSSQHGSAIILILRLSNVVTPAMALTTGGV